MAQQVFDDEVLGKAYDGRLMRKAIVFVLPYKKQLVVALLAMIVAKSADLVAPQLVGYAIDKGIGKGDTKVVMAAAVIYVVTYLVYWIGQYWQGVLVSKLGQTVIYDIRRTIFSHVQGMSLDFFDKREVGRIISRLTSDVDSLNALLTAASLSLVSDTISLIAVLVIMAKMNLKLTLLIFTLSPFLWAVTSIFRAKSRVAYRNIRQKVATVTAHVAENISGVKVVKSFSREKENLRRFEVVNEENKDALMRAGFLGAVFWPTIDIIFAGGTAMVFWYGGMQIVSGVLTIGALVKFYLYLDRFFTPIRNMSQFYQTMQGAMAGAERIFEILDTEPTIKNSPGAAVMPVVRGDVEFRNVNFAYGEKPILQDMSFAATAGQTIALVGPTGAGKTTIINLLGRQYDIQSGTILIDGLDIRDVTLKSLRRQIGVVLQDSFLFPGSVKDNIRYGRLDASDQEVEAAARAVGAHEFISHMDKGYNTDIHEGGSNISSGQKQLLSFARALLADPRILILDEATSSIDTATEMVIQEALRTLLKGRTSFVIAHRLSTISEADKILAIEDGRVVESGTHRELLNRDGLYRRLHDMQFSADHM